MSRGNCPQGSTRPLQRMYQCNLWPMVRPEYVPRGVALANKTTLHAIQACGLNEGTSGFTSHMGTPMRILPALQRLPNTIPQIQSDRQMRVLATISFD